MALATSVTGTGRLISKSNEKGSYQYTATSVDTTVEPNVSKSYTVTVEYTETRTEHKWYALTESAVTTYMASHPNDTLNGSCVNEKLQAWELTQTSVTRTIDSVSAVLNT